MTPSQAGTSPISSIQLTPLSAVSSDENSPIRGDATVALEEDVEFWQDALEKEVGRAKMTTLRAQYQQKADARNAQINKDDSIFKME